MSTRNWRMGLLGLLLAGAVLCGVQGSETSKSPFGGAIIVQPEEPEFAPATSKPSARELTYKGRTYQQWLDEFQYELDPARRVGALKALVVFGSNGKAGEVVKHLLNLMDGYRLEVVPMAYSRGGGDLVKWMKTDEGSSSLHGLGFLDEDDVRLFQAAISGLSRIAGRATPELISYVQQPGDASTGRLAALLVLRTQPSSGFAEVLPDIVERDGILALYALEAWQASPMFATPAEYQRCIERLLKLKDQSKLRDIVSSLESSNHQPQSRVAIPLLQELVKTDLDPETKSSITGTLQKLEKTYGKPALILPASDTKER